MLKTEVRHLKIINY